MSNSKKNKKNKQTEYQKPVADKQDYAVAKYLHDKVQKRIGDLHGMEVDCFYAEDAVNCLLDSKWATGKTALFTDRQSAVNFCHEMLLKELFHRASLVKRKPKLPKVTDGNDTPGESGTEGKKAKKKAKQKEEESKDTKTEEGKTDDSKKVKKIKKLKLSMSDDQYFDDGREIYVWIYEPVSWTKFLIGFSILFGAIALCCYPLWPEWMRIGVYYLSIAGAGFLGVIIALAIIRYIVWAIIYLVTMRKHSFFLFPNLTEDCGFFESFVPIYEYTQLGQESSTSKSNKGKDKCSDDPPTEDIGQSGAGDGEVTAENEGITGDEGPAEGSDNSQGSDFEVIGEPEVSS